MFVTIEVDTLYLAAIEGKLCVSDEEYMWDIGGDFIHTTVHPPDDIT